MEGAAARLFLRLIMSMQKRGEWSAVTTRWPVSQPREQFPLLQAGSRIANRCTIGSNGPKFFQLAL
jgi:hypothetical protein